MELVHYVHEDVFGSRRVGGSLGGYLSDERKAHFKEKRLLLFEGSR